MSGQGQVAKSVEVDVTNDETVENKDLVDDVQSITVEDKDAKAVNKAAVTTTSASLEDSGMEVQETKPVAVSAPPLAPEPAKMEKKVEEKKVDEKKVEEKKVEEKKIDEIVEKKVEKKVEEKVEEKVEKKVEEKVEKMVAKKVEEIVEKKKVEEKKVEKPLLSLDVPVKEALKKSQDLMHGFDIASKNTGMCVGYFKVEGADAPVLAACTKLPDNTCPVNFAADSCVALKPVNVEVTKGAKVMMF